ncbi:MAG: polysaccharide deacetylase family protein [Pseudomonadota bacterium]
MAHRHIKSLVKSALLACGAARLYHYARNRRALSVVMFHRILPEDDPRFAGADPAYTATLREFEAALDFFQTYYAPVSLAEVESAAREGTTLPDHPLLITFDDGWRDNVEYAAPVLERRGLPSVLFVATGHIGSDKGFWPEQALAWALTGPESDAEKRRLAGGGQDNPAADRMDFARNIVAAFAAAPEGPRAVMLDRIAAHGPGPRAMADAEDLKRFRAAGGAIAGHGHSHEPLTDVGDAREDIQACHARLQETMGQQNAPAFSFPHGRYTSEILHTVQEAGFGLVFTSDPGMAPVSALAQSAPIPRIEVDFRAWRGAQGFRASDFAFYMMTQRIAA